ncbi:MAG: hypothetical protein II098_10200 [Treponema sp.]|nr:hypothetical protein [Treponema sp.]
MKKIRVIYTFAGIAGLLFLFSCASVPAPSDVEKTDDDNFITQDNESRQEGKVIKEPKPISVQNTSNQLETEFKNLLKRIELKVESSPKATTANRGFNAPYVVTVKDENGPVAGLELTVNWPIGRTNDTVTYSATRIKTDSEGKVSFTPAAPKFAVKDKVTFYPSPVSSSSQIVKAAYETAVSAPYAVKSEYLGYPGGLLYTYDFNEKGNPTTNNFLLLQSLRNIGVNVGNSPVSDTSYFNMPVSELYKETYNIVGKSYKFMVMGAFKYAAPAEETADGATVTLTADITCIDMNNGNILYKTSFTETVTDKNKWTADQKCRKILAEKAADAIVYGM